MNNYAKQNPVSIAGAVTGLLVALVALGLDAVNWGDSVEAQLVVIGGILAAFVGGLIGRWFQRWTIPVAGGDEWVDPSVPPDYLELHEADEALDAGFPPDPEGF